VIGSSAVAITGTISSVEGFTLVRLAVEQALLEHDAGPQTRQQHFFSLVLGEERKMGYTWWVVWERKARRGLQSNSGFVK
jgi:hypothetical protein